MTLIQYFILLDKDEKYVKVRSVLLYDIKNCCTHRMDIAIH